MALATAASVMVLLFKALTQPPAPFGLLMSAARFRKFL